MPVPSLTFCLRVDPLDIVFAEIRSRLHLDHTQHRAARVAQAVRRAHGHIDRSVLVPDESITAAQQLLWDKLRVIAEPGGAAALAALTSGAYRPEPGERVGVLLCGANTTVRFG